MNRTWGFLLVFWVLPLFVSANTISKEIHIVPGSFVAVDNSTFPYLNFGESGSFDHQALLIEANFGDVLNLWVFNHDSMNHNFEITNYATLPNPVLPGDSAYLELNLNTAGAFIMFDPLDFPRNIYLGLGGMLVVKDHSQPSFYWNIKEHQADFNTQLVAGNIVDWASYYPTFFTINGVSNPNINLDANARITGQLGDSIYLYMANTGQSIHSMHFHGYHATLVLSSKNPNHVGRVKDTFPIFPMESLVLLLVPDKPGEYPVHDHNLVAVSGNGYYPNGMFTTILINP